jgi:hypothetical protein
MRSRIPRSVPFWRAASLSATLLGFALVPARWVEMAPPVCVFRNLFGISCPGCGMTRAFSALLHADLSAAMGYNRLVLVVFPILCAVIVRDVAKLISAYHQREIS